MKWVRHRFQNVFLRFRNNMKDLASLGTNRTYFMLISKKKYKNEFQMLANFVEKFAPLVPNHLFLWAYSQLRRNQYTLL